MLINFNLNKCANMYSIENSIFKHPDLRGIDFIDSYLKLSEKLDLDFTEIINVLKHIPIPFHSDEHKKSRSEMFSLYLSNKDKKDNMKKYIENQINSFLINGKRNVLEDFINPLIKEQIYQLIGIKLVAEVDRFLDIFNIHMGIKRRKALNSDISKLRMELETKLPSLSKSDIYKRIGLILFATESTRGFIGCGLHSIFKSGYSNNIDEITKIIPNNIIIKKYFRTPKCPFEYEGIKYSDKQIMIFDYGNQDFETRKKRLKLFGIDKHTCIGRDLALGIWQSVTSELLNQKTKFIQIIDYDLLKSDLFVYPTKFTIRVH